MRRRELLQKKSAIVDGYEYVDMGNNLLWAKCNIGAENEYELGTTYKWGATKANGVEYQTINVKTLPLSADTARQVMGGGWRMPTSAECKTLLDACKKTIVNVNNKSCWELSVGNKSLIFYTSGATSLFWTSSSNGNAGTYSAKGVSGNSSTQKVVIGDYSRSNTKMPVRGVHEK